MAAAIPPFLPPAQEFGSANRGGVSCWGQEMKVRCHTLSKNPLIRHPAMLSPAYGLRWHSYWLSAWPVEARVPLGGDGLVRQRWLCMSPNPPITLHMFPQGQQCYLNLFCTFPVGTAVLPQTAGPCPSGPTSISQGETASQMPPPQAISAVPLFRQQATAVGNPHIPSQPELEAIASHLAASNYTPPTSQPQQPLLLSTALPPIPARVVEKVRSGTFIEMKELLPDNVALLRRLKEIGAANHPSPANSARLRDIRILLSWASCFMSFVAAKSDHRETRELMAYGKIIISLAQGHGGLGWATYDSLFRQQVAAGAEPAWTQLNASLMAATVLGAGNEPQPRPCFRCQATDHSAQECALASIDNTPPPSRSSWTNRSSARYRPYNQQEEICCRFNRGTCSAASCKYEHRCATCQKAGHGSHECSRRPLKPAMAENVQPALTKPRQ